MTNQKMPPKDTHPGRRIACAANKVIPINPHPNDPKFYIIAGVRHWDLVMHNIWRGISANWSTARKGGVRDEQGFLDNMGTFLTREEAWPIAVAAGQIVRLVSNQVDLSPGQTLWSENLY